MMKMRANMMYTKMLFVNRIGPDDRDVRQDGEVDHLEPSGIVELWILAEYARR